MNTDPSDRFSQWSLNETRDFITIRAELDQTFMDTKRNKLLWDVISSKMKEKGHNRTPHQCKCKWKNLVTRFKGTEAMEPEIARQFPFQDELRAIFAARMQRLLWLEPEREGGPSNKKSMVRSSSEEDESNDESERRKRMKKNKGPVKESNGDVKEMLEEFMREQMKMEVKWLEVAEVREEERRRKETEWRMTMESIEKERVLMDRRWREREEQRWLRQEARAEKRDALLTTLLNKLIHEDFSKPC
ncbi:trihelix transcription factor GT-3b-like [Tasmannia lanceolata]|uniref:trihelix transcription factor GT-3b-like n=1 Tax=Tasmannia lanceolata TaxID=3420 RepID=UPI004063C706